MTDSGMIDKNDPPARVMHRAFFAQLFSYAPDLGTLYLANAKSGSSMVKKFLLNGSVVGKNINASAFVHDGKWWEQEHAKAFQPERKFSFTLVRNPFARALSAYLDKISRPNLLRTRFCIENGLDETAEIGFEDFLESLDPSTTVLDQHFKPQVDNVYAGTLPLDMVFALERFSDTAPVLAEKLKIPIETRSGQKHATGASEKVRSFFSDAAIEHVRRLYSRDFARFGYSTEINDIDEAPSDVMSFADEEPFARATLIAIDHLHHRRLELANQQIQTFSSASETELPIEMRLVIFAEKWRNRAHLFDLTNVLPLLENCQTPAERIPVLDLISLIALKRDNLPLAEASCRDLIEIAPYLAGFRLRLIECLLTMERFEAAEIEMQTLERTSWSVPAIEKLKAKLIKRVEVAKA